MVPLIPTTCVTCKKVKIIVVVFFFPFPCSILNLMKQKKGEHLWCKGMLFIIIIHNHIFLCFHASLIIIQQNPFFYNSQSSIGVCLFFKSVFIESSVRELKEPKMMRIFMTINVKYLLLIFQHALIFFSAFFSCFKKTPLDLTLCACQFRTAIQSGW